MSVLLVGSGKESSLGTAVAGVSVEFPPVVTATMGTHMGTGEVEAETGAPINMARHASQMNGSFGGPFKLRHA